MTADDIYDDALDILQRRMKGDPDVTDDQYQVARDIMSTVFVTIRFDRKHGEFPDHIEDP